MQRVDRRSASAVLGGAALTALVQFAPAAAHPGHTSSDIVAGLQHPLLGVDHLLAMVVVGVLATVLARPLAAPASFVGGMALGGALGAVGPVVPFAEVAVALSVVALGGAVLAGRRLQPRLALGLVALAGLVHGHAHGAEVPAGASAVTFGLGFLAVTAALHGAGVLGGLAVRDRVRARATLGAIVVGAGAGLLAGVL